MKIAVTCENGQIFQRFGHAEQLKVYMVEDGKIMASKVKFVVSTNEFIHKKARCGVLFSLYSNR